VQTVAFSPDSEQALTGSDDGSIRLWDARVPDVQSIAHPDESAVEVVTFTPDGAQLLTGDAAGIARLWNAATGEVVQSFNGHTRAIEAVDLTPDGNYALTAATTDVTARIWDVATGAEVGTLEHPTNKFVYDAEFSAAGDQILTGNQGGSAYLWDWDSATLTSTLVHTLTHESTSTITGVAISPDGSQLATVSARQVFLWDAATGEVIRAFGDENGRFLNAVAFSPDGAWLAAVDQNFAVRLWQIDTGASRFLEKLSRASAPASVAFSPDGSRLVVDGSLEAYIWDVASGSLINVLAEHEAEINQATFSPDSSQVATASDDGTARIWDATAGSALSATPGGHTDSVEDIDFYSDGQTLVSGSWDGTLKLWDTASGTVRQTLRTAATGSGNAAISVVDVSADDRFIAAVEWNTLLLWDAQSGLLLRSFVPGTYDQLYTVALSPDGALLAAGGTGRTIYLFDTATGEEVRRFTQHSSLINDVMFSPDGSRLISGSDDGAALLWDVNDENVTLASFGRGEPIEAVAFSSDGERVATGDTQGVIVWDVNTAQEVNRLGEEILSSTPNIAAVAFASDGNYLLTARTSVAELWDIASGKLLRAYTGHTSRTAGNAAYINALAVAPDGTRFATSGARGNNNVRLWEVEVRPAVRSFADPDDAGYTSVAVSSDGQTVVTGNCDATAYLWDATTGAQLLSIPNFPGRTGPGGGPCVAYLDLSPDDTTLLAGTSTTLRLHDVQTGEALRTFTPHRWATFAAQFSADGEQIVTAGSDPRPRGCLEECGEAKLWDTASGELQATFIHDSQVSAAALSPDGRYLATADSFTGQAWLWDATNPTAPIVELRGGSSVIDSIAFSPDSSRILAGTRGGTAVMWDSATGGFLYSFNHGVYNQRVRHVAFANTQPWLVTTSEQTAYVWHSETGELLFAASAAWTMEDAVFTPDDRYLLTGNASGAATFWETADE
jgi:WD40 repeat protein